MLLVIFKNLNGALKTVTESVSLAGTGKAKEATVSRSIQIPLGKWKELKNDRDEGRFSLKLVSDPRKN
jgi:hypothetical protein